MLRDKGRSHHADSGSERPTFAFFDEEKDKPGAPRQRTVRADGLSARRFVAACRQPASDGSLYLQQAIMENPVHTMSGGVEVFDDEGMLGGAIRRRTGTPPNACAGSALKALTQEASASCDWEWLNRARDAAHAPGLATVYLLAGQRDGLSPLHYDLRDNFFAQLSGRKRLLLFPPSAWASLRPHRTSSPLDRRATCDLDGGGGPKAGGGLEVVLSPGEVLYLPICWWHHVHQLDPENVSLAFWCLVPPVPPADRETPRDRACRELRLARDLDEFLEDVEVQPRRVRAVLHFAMRLLDGDGRAGGVREAEGAAESETEAMTEAEEQCARTIADVVRARAGGAAAEFVASFLRAYE